MPSNPARPASDATTPQEPWGRLGIERIVKEDGRALILYTHVDEPPQAPVEPPQAPEDEADA